eukprot:gnl/TRDRNA2_/TRDRNA2_175685_c0_seq3.p1 gnl/TRDRNA2_/TRDRNA2_175685_c0~~gnl/TRDRNA2_/TRDRNA2_175685_c0_seq3.p1  ORF type:complete len:167 (-),score=36.07 gnl/TRDRNA2_/TRDRNA2_175685_c0_seq3:149-649(-)
MSEEKEAFRRLMLCEDSLGSSSSSDLDPELQKWRRAQAAKVQSANAAWKSDDDHMQEELHAEGKCQPCTFFARGMCEQGRQCDMCHLPHDAPKKKKSQAANFRTQAANYRRVGIMLQTELAEEKPHEGVLKTRQTSPAVEQVMLETTAAVGSQSASHSSRTTKIAL